MGVTGVDWREGLGMGPSIPPPGIAEGFWVDVTLLKLSTRHSAPCLILAILMLRVQAVKITILAMHIIVWHVVHAVTSCSGNHDNQDSHKWVMMGTQVFLLTGVLLVCRRQLCPTSTLKMLFDRSYCTVMLSSATVSMT